MAYQIHDIEQLTGIKAHTIRIWEKRYNLIEPLRTKTNIRYYTDDQARRLLNISTLVNSGNKISRLATMTDEQLSFLVRELQLSDSKTIAYSSFITSLTSAMLSFDESKFESMLEEIVARFGAYDAMTKVIYPFLVKVGVMWSSNEVMPAQEHFASCFIRDMLIRETADLPAAWRNDKKFLLFLPPQEWHEIGLLLTSYMVKAAGYRVTYLGQSVPFENVVRTFNATKPTHLISFYFAERKKVNLVEEFMRLSQNIQSAGLLICGRSEMLQRFPAGSTIRTFPSVSDMEQFLKS